MKRLLGAIIMSIGVATVSAQKVLPPTMGWSSWNTYHENISADLIKSQADAMVSTGLSAKGYQFINIDDGYQVNRDRNGNLLVNERTFPEGLKAVADYIHSKGLKAGIYTDAGYRTCMNIWGRDPGGRAAGIYGLEDKDCEQFFVNDGFDFIKVDFCGGEAKGSNDLALDPQTRYEEIADAIKHTRKDVRLNLCRWAYPGVWAARCSDSWRTTEDIQSNWPSVKAIIQQSLYLSGFCSPGHYNDMDMLEVGVTRDGVLTRDEAETHFGLWCLMSSPLLIGCDMSTLGKDDLELLGNEELIAVNQDKLGQQAYVVSRQDGAYILVRDFKEAEGKTRVVALYNSTDVPRNMTLHFRDACLGGKVAARDMIRRADLGSFIGSITKEVPAHGTVFLRLEAEKRLPRTLYEAETATLTAYHETAALNLCPAIDEVTAPEASGGVVVRQLGGMAVNTSNPRLMFSNDIVWNNVYAVKECDASLTITYLCADKRDMAVEVNGKEVKRLKGLSSGGDDKTGKITIKVHLKKGNNTVRLYNESGSMPDIDKIERN